MTVIYIDVLFLLNLIIDYVLLLATARITGEIFSRVRLALGGAVGALYAVALFAPNCGWMSHIVCKICVAVMMILIAFGARRHLLKLFLVFVGASVALGGLVLALQLIEVGGLSVEKGVFYTGFDTRLLLVTVILCYVGIRIVFEGAARHGGRRKDMSVVKIELEKQQLDLKVLWDTGNTLTDPLNNRPVMVAEWGAVKHILPDGIDPTDPVGSMERMRDHILFKRFRLIPYRAVGLEYGMLLAVRCDRIRFHNREMKGLLVALSPTPVSDNGSYQALMGEI